MTWVINDPLGQVHCPASSDHYFHVKFVLFYEILNLRTDNTCENSDHYRPWLWVGRMDQGMH